MQPRYDTVFSFEPLASWCLNRTKNGRIFFFKSTKISLKRSAIISFHYFIFFFRLFFSLLPPFFHWMRLCWVRDDVHIALPNASKILVYEIFGKTKFDKKKKTDIGAIDRNWPNVPWRQMLGGEFHLLDRNGPGKKIVQNGQNAIVLCGNKLAFDEQEQNKIEENEAVQRPTHAV